MVAAQSDPQGSGHSTARAMKRFNYHAMGGALRLLLLTAAPATRSCSNRCGEVEIQVSRKIFS